MAINTSVYGNSAQWTNAFFQQAQIEDKNKLAYFGENAKTLSQGVANNKLSYSEPIDKSLSYCGLGTESAMSHVVYCGLHENAFQAYDSTDRQVTNFAFFEKQSNLANSPNYFLNYTELNRFAWTPNIDTDFNYTQDLIPYTVINPHNILLYISLYVSGGGTYEYTSLNYFKNNYQTHGWNRIAHVKLTTYFGNNADNVSWSASAGYDPAPRGYGVNMGILDEYVVSTKNKRFCMYENPTYNLIPFGFVGENHIGSNSEDVFYMCYIPESAKSHIKYDSTNREFYIEYYDDIVEDILKTVACFGLYFCTTTADLGNLTNEYTYIGLIDDDGVGRGRYLQGAETVNAPQAQSGFKDMHSIPYDYKAVDNTKYSNGTNFNLWDFSLNCINKFYVLTESQVEQLSTELYTIMGNVSSDTPIERYNQTVFLTQNPIDCIVSIKRFPVDVPHLGTNAALKLGSQSTGITTAHYLLRPCNVYYFSFNESNNTGLFQANGGSFLDYEPYTKVSINVPFCGSFDVPCNYFYEYGGVDIALLIDFITGACTAFLMANGNVVDSIQGECGVNVPLSGLQTATIDSQIFNASMSKQKQDNNFALSMLGGAAAIALGVATGGAAAVVGGAAALTGGVLNKISNDKSIDYDLQHMQAPIKQVSSASPVIARANDMRCKMIISRPEYIDNYNETVYAETIGFACLLNGNVSDFSGFTVGKINLDGINAPKEVKEMIESAFASGVYL